MTAGKSPSAWKETSSKADRRYGCPVELWDSLDVSRSAERLKPTLGTGESNRRAKALKPETPRVEVGHITYFRVCLFISEGGQSVLSSELARSAEGGQV